MVPILRSAGSWGGQIENEIIPKTTGGPIQFYFKPLMGYTGMVLSKKKGSNYTADERTTKESDQSAVKKPGGGGSMSKSVRITRKKITEEGFADFLISY